MKPHYIKRDEDSNENPNLAAVHPASDEAVNLVMNAPVGDDDGRSPWVWVRLANGDLVLGVFPCGETYFAVEADAHFPGEA